MSVEEILTLDFVVFCFAIWVSMEVFNAVRDGIVATARLTARKLRK